jgi:hypothetical protein
MTTDIKRYDSIHPDSGWRSHDQMEECDDGPYVKHTDHLAALHSRDERIAEANARGMAATARVMELERRLARAEALLVEAGEELYRVSPSRVHPKIRAFLGETK